MLNILCKDLASPAPAPQPQWLQLHTPLLVDKLAALFFGRVRSGKHPLSWSLSGSAGRSPLPEVVSDWVGVERILLPLLPAAVKQPVFDAIASVLNGPCLGPSPSNTQMQPKKWSRHVLYCAELMAAHRVVVSLVPMQRRYWTELLDGLLDACDAQSVQATSATHSQLHSRAEFVLHGVLELLLLAAADSAGDQMRSLFDPAAMLDVWTCALLLASTAPESDAARELKSNLLAVYLDAVEVFPATDRTAFLSSLLDAAADYCRRADIRSGFIIRKGSHTRLFNEVLQAELLGFVTSWMDHFYPIPHTSSRQRTRYAASPWHDALQATDCEADLWHTVQVAISARAGALRGNHGALYSEELYSQSRLSVTGGGGGQSGESPCGGRPGCILLDTAQRDRRGPQGNPNRMAQVRSI